MKTYKVLPKKVKEYDKHTYEVYEKEVNVYLVQLTEKEYCKAKRIFNLPYTPIVSGDRIKKIVRKKIYDVFFDKYPKREKKYTRKIVKTIRTNNGIDYDLIEETKKLRKRKNDHINKIYLEQVQKYRLLKEKQKRN